MKQGLPTSEWMSKWQPSADAIRRFWAKVDKNGPVPASNASLGPCWQWISSRSRDGYGSFGAAYRYIVGAHRAAWVIQAGHLPVGAHVLHKCDNRSCVNGSHLFLGTHVDNMRDMAEKGRASAHNNFPDDFSRRGEDNGRAKLTVEDVREIRRLFAIERVSQPRLAERFGVSSGIISKIVRRVLWPDAGGVVPTDFSPRDSFILEHNGESATMAQWASKLGIKRATIKSRLGRGLPMRMVLSAEPLHIGEMKRFYAEQRERKAS